MDLNAFWALAESSGQDGRLGWRITALAVVRARVARTSALFGEVA
ncbi:hypothetical protein [Lentzea flaviverrucosa]|uniref:DUF4240 domain-containing protein n=1 Tax=Lentzea flaviverrucosa TaxID=200379 RepID=A0A1H9B3Q4_9PSEU|nr:hypothetical protein [Lentzea flaviverrucosa]RDI31908.1 hypothetical protein DFR72_103309 [Lentzea flaviverrucosa]SEP82858.1 hypothetical protein SAMN05216195_101349 [Lentzea flaviverrucosa]